MPIKGLVFDAYGTLYDVHSVQTKTEQLCPGKGDLITQIFFDICLDLLFIERLDVRGINFVSTQKIAMTLIELPERSVRP